LTATTADGENQAETKQPQPPQNPASGLKVSEPRLSSALSIQLLFDQLQIKLHSNTHSSEIKQRSRLTKQTLALNIRLYTLLDTLLMVQNSISVRIQAGGWPEQLEARQLKGHKATLLQAVGLDAGQQGQFVLT